MPSAIAFLSPLPLPLPSPSLPAPSSIHSPRPNACAPPPLKEPSLPPTAPPFPTPLHNTTLLHSIPLPLHPLSHPLDGDGYILALSAQASGDVWLRARFIRTRAFLRETTAARRLYRGTYGTPGLTGWNAPLKPKATSSEGVFVWAAGSKRRVCAWGRRSLPFVVDVATLVTKGTTALGSVLTDSQELVSTRATELVASPVRVGESVYVPGLSRAQTGRVLGVFVTEVGREGEVKKRLPRVDVPGKCVVGGFAVGEGVCVLLMHKTGKEGVLGSLFGGKEKGEPELDVGFGSLIVVLPLDGRAAGVCQLPGSVVTRVVAVEDEGEGVGVEVLVLEGKEDVKPSTIGDARSSRLWTMGQDNGGVRARRGRVSVEAGKGKMAKKINCELIADAGEMDVSIIDAAHSERKNRGKGEGVFTVFDHGQNRAGVGRVAGTGRMAGVWLVEKENMQVSGPLLSEDGKFLNVLVTCEYPERGAAKSMVFDVEDIARGPIHEMELDVETFGEIGCSSGGVWTNVAVDWSEDGSKPVKSAYEIFNAKRWNDIESGFSSLGFNQ